MLILEFRWYNKHAFGLLCFLVHAPLPAVIRNYDIGVKLSKFQESQQSVVVLEHSTSRETKLKLYKVMVVCTGLLCTQYCVHSYCVHYTQLRNEKVENWPQ